MSAKHHPLSPDCRLHTEDLFVAHHVLIFVGDHGSRQCRHLRGNELLLFVPIAFSVSTSAKKVMFLSRFVCVGWLVCL